MNKSFLKWAGGKYDLLPTLVPMVLESLAPKGRFIEPFLGGGTLALNLPVETPRILNDINPGVMACWDALLLGDEVIKDARGLFSDENNTEKQFYKFRSIFNQPDLKDSSLYPAFFLYLNRHCFNGLCRFNAKGDFNVPYGRYKTIYFPEKELRHAAEVAKNSVLLKEDFVNVMNLATQGDVVYCDPPYIPLSKTSSFVGYSKGGFSLDDQIRLRDRAERLRDRGVTVIISNNDTPVARELYAKADKIEKIQVAKRISCKGSGRKKSGELIAVYMP